MSLSIRIELAQPLSKLAISPSAISPRSIESVLHFHQALVGLAPLVGSKHGGLKLSGLKFNFPTIISKKKADDAGGEDSGARCDLLPGHALPFQTLGYRADERR